MTQADLQAQAKAAKLIREYERAVKQNRLRVEYADLARHGHDGGPYDWQERFHAEGIDHNERALIAGNRVGKTRTAAAEVAIHLTGRYPEWWRGRRFSGPTRWIVAGESNESTRDVPQTALVGGFEEGEREPDGTGWIPKVDIISWSFRQCGVQNVLDTVMIRHVSGGISQLQFKSFEQGDTKFQGTSRHGVWLDEEPPSHKIYSECQFRVLDTNGLILFTRTPLFGMSETVHHFIKGGPGIMWVGATVYDAPHLDTTAIERLAATAPEHERETRLSGDPLMGSGRVYTVPDEKLVCRPFQIPRHFRRVVGIDFGIGHPFAAAWLALDPDSDVLYLYDCYRRKGETHAYHTTAIAKRGPWIPLAWPHDGLTRDKGSGVQLIQPYRDAELNVMELSARFQDETGGPQSREQATIDLLERMNTGRFRVFSPQCDEFLEEKRLLHRKDGVIVPTHDDIESAVRYGSMMLRYASTHVENTTRKPPFADDQGAGDTDPLRMYN